MEALEQIAEWVCERGPVVAFTGAGISTESGIPDFRSPGGIWSKSKPVYFEAFLRSAEARYEYWRQKAAAHRDMADAKPNCGHRILARWEKAGMLQAVITQNIDGMHQRAGSKRVLELHGTALHVACLDCPARFEAEPLVRQFLETDRTPQCPKCGGRLKHATVSFGQSLPELLLQEAARLSAESEVFLAMGSSLVVQPAAGLPMLAKEHGAQLVIINRDATELDPLADHLLHAPISETLSAIDAFVRKRES